MISHKMPDGSEKPVAFGSRMLTKAEKNYYQFEKEALGLVFGVMKFHEYLLGGKFTLIADHKQLLKVQKQEYLLWLQLGCNDGP